MPQYLNFSTESFNKSSWGNILSPRTQFRANCFSQGTFHILISKAVDQWVQHGDDNCVENRGYFVRVQGVTGAGSEIHEEERAEEEGHGGEVGGAGREGSAPARGGLHPEDGGEDVAVGQEDSDDAGPHNTAAGNGQRYLADGCI